MRYQELVVASSFSPDRYLDRNLRSVRHGVGEPRHLASPGPAVQYRLSLAPDRSAARIPSATSASQAAISSGSA
jgi:hypothetical protein